MPTEGQKALPRADAQPPPGNHSCLEVFRVFLRLGLTSFGGPVAHLGYFHAEFVSRRRWLGETAYADLVALCQFLPGPASSQVGMALGLTRAGLPGMLAAWCGFTLPSALLMIGFAYGVGVLGDLSHAGWLHGLKLAAVAVVAQAVWSMAVKLCPDRLRATFALVAAGAVLAFPAALVQVAVIGLGAFAGWGLLPATDDDPADHPAAGIPPARPFSRKLGAVALAVFFTLLVVLPALPGGPAVRLFDGFYRTGSLVFGGGHVVLPLLHAETVERGWLAEDRFLAGYGAAQAVPGPLFTFAGYLGASLRPPLPQGWVGGLLCLAAIFVPSALLVLGALPFWDALRRRKDAQAALRGANAVVVGVLLAALYQPVWTSGVRGPRDVIVVLAAYGLLVFWRCPPWLVVGLAALAGALLSA